MFNEDAYMLDHHLSAVVLLTIHSRLKTTPPLNVENSQSIPPSATISHHDHLLFFVTILTKFSEPRYLLNKYEFVSSFRHTGNLGKLFTDVTGVSQPINKRIPIHVYTHLCTGREVREFQQRLEAGRPEGSRIRGGISGDKVDGRGTRFRLLVDLAS